MAKKAVNKTKQSAIGTPRSKRGTTTAITDTPKKTAKSSQARKEFGTSTAKAKVANPPQAAKKSARAAKPRETVQQSAQFDTAQCGAVPTFEQIRNRAYENYLKRSGSPGDARSDWLHAEQELVQLLAAKTGVTT